MSRRLVLEVILLVGIFGLAAWGGITSDPPREINVTEVELEVHEEVNERRKSRALSKLSYNQTLAEIAQYHSDDMAASGYVGHESPSGESLIDRYKADGVSCSGGENIHYRAIGFDSEDEIAEAIVDSWMNSTGHRKNLLKPQHSTEGLGINITELENGSYRLYATQNFC